MYRKANASAGTLSVSSALTGTVTGWLAAIFEFSSTGSNCGLQGSAQASSSVAQLTNIFPVTGRTLDRELFLYAVASAGANLTPANSFNSPLCAWSASTQQQANVQGLSMDFFWGSGLGQGVGQYPIATGLLDSAVASVAIAAWFNTIATQPDETQRRGGGSGYAVFRGHNRGMTGGD